MGVRFAKNLYQALSFGLSFCFLSVILLWGFAESQKYKGEYGEIFLWAGIGVFLLYFVIGFYWLFQVVQFDEKGVCLLLFGRVVRFVPWEKIYAVRCEMVMKNPAVIIKITGEKDLCLDDRRGIRQAIGMFFRRRIFGEMEECYAIIKNAESEARIRKYDDPQTDPFWNGTSCKKFFGFSYKSEDFSFQLFAYEFKDVASTRLYSKGKAKKMSEVGNEASYFIHAASGDQVRISVYYGEKAVTVYTYKEQERNVMAFLYSYFSVSATPYDIKTF